MSLLNDIRLDKTAIQFGTLDDEGDDRAFWQAKSMEERLEALELMRQIAYGYDPDTSRLHRVLEFTELSFR
jgi:hypothetical protein